MKRNWPFVAILAAIVLAGGILWWVNVSKSAIAAVNSKHLLATLCDLPGLGCGGTLITQPLPCFGTGAVWAKVLVAGVDAGGPATSYIFWPTIYFYHLPTHIGQSFVGLTTGRGFCATDPTNFDKGFTAPSSWFYGTSL